jgi:Holliday junction DNA helicase RuvA
MIERVRGAVVARRPGSAVLDVGGLGLEVQLTARAQAALPRNGDAVVLTRYIVREDAVSLYGFADEDEREGFDRLLAVAGVGPRLALATVSALAPDRLRRVLAAGETTALLAVPGVGKKLAQRIVLDLKDWAAAAVGADPDMPSEPAADRGATAALDAEPESATAVLALVGLGYPPPEARAAVGRARAAGATAAEALVRDALRQLAPATARVVEDGERGEVRA